MINWPPFRFAFVVCLTCSCCSSEPDQTPASAAADPLQTVKELLVLHRLEGQQPEERSTAEKETPVDRAALARLFTDLGERDPFLDELYVGFVVGLLARHQERLFVERQGSRARVWAGQTAIALRLDQERWRIDLEGSIPEEIRRRALEEKTRLESAGQAEGTHRPMGKDSQVSSPGE